MADKFKEFSEYQLAKYNTRKHRCKHNRNKHKAKVQKRSFRSMLKLTLNQIVVILHPVINKQQTICQYLW